jgi:HEAT repeat protein
MNRMGLVRRLQTGMVCLALPALLLGAVSALGAQSQSAAELIQQFTNSPIFWQQLEIAQTLVQLHDASILPRLEPLLSHGDRHIRGNAAFIFAALGDRRGFDVITAILNDRSERPEGQGGSEIRGGWRLNLQISQDRYYAVHLLGLLKDPRAVPLLVALLQDDDVNYKVAWALGEIGGPAAVEGLLDALFEKSPDVRVIAIDSLAKLNATDALPRLRTLLDDNEKSRFGRRISVADAARAAIAKLELDRVPESVERYARDMDAAMKSSAPVSLESVFEEGTAAAEALVRDQLERLGEPTYRKVQSTMTGFWVNREEAVFAVPDAGFLLKLAREKGTAVDRAFFEALRKTYPLDIWPAYEEAQSDFAGCTVFDGKGLPESYAAWLAFQNAYPGRYQAGARKEVARIEAALQSTCACGGEDGVRQGLDNFMRAFPASPMAATVAKRLAAIGDHISDIRFSCVPR